MPAQYKKVAAYLSSSEFKAKVAAKKARGQRGIIINAGGPNLISSTIVTLKAARLEAGLHWQGDEPHCLLFASALLLDADSMPLANPEGLWNDASFKATGNLFFPDFWATPASSQEQGLAYDLVGLEHKEAQALLAAGKGRLQRDTESGQLLFDLVKHADVAEWALWINSFGDTLYKAVWGDKDTYSMAFAVAGKAHLFNQLQVPPGAALTWRNGSLLVKATQQKQAGWQLAGMLQFDAAGQPAFLHRTMNKFSWGGEAWHIGLLTGPLPLRWVKYYLSQDSQGPTVGVPYDYVAPGDAFVQWHVPAPLSRSSARTGSWAAGPDEVKFKQQCLERMALRACGSELPGSALGLRLTEELRAQHLRAQELQQAHQRLLNDIDSCASTQPAAWQGALGAAASPNNSTLWLHMLHVHPLPCAQAKAGCTRVVSVRLHLVSHALAMQEGRVARAAGGYHNGPAKPDQGRRPRWAGCVPATPGGAVAAVPAGDGVPADGGVGLRIAFHEENRKQLYSSENDRQVFAQLLQASKELQWPTCLLPCGGVFLTELSEGTCIATVLHSWLLGLHCYCAIVQVCLKYRAGVQFKYRQPLSRLLLVQNAKLAADAGSGTPAAAAELAATCVEANSRLWHADARDLAAAHPLLYFSQLDCCSRCGMDAAGLQLAAQLMRQGASRMPTAMEQLLSQPAAAAAATSALAGLVKAWAMRIKGSKARQADTAAAVAGTGAAASSAVGQAAVLANTSEHDQLLACIACFPAAVLSLLF
ncbi:mannosyltransferase putative-domain-containing protein [Scenedesmus sp. NREL 46B-D3]|nr:mannosyltransferase putative-domain-containing protein [Scenedesmus sp. NREL 46B-D3]